MKTKYQIIGSLLICLSFGMLVFWLVLKTGYEVSARGASTPLMDSSGHELGFLQPLTWELVAMMMAKVSVHDVMQRVAPPVVWCAMAHGIGLLVLWLRVVTIQMKTAFFAAQLVFFASGFLGILMWTAGFLISAVPDGECIDDDPLWASAFAGWFFVSALIAGTTWCIARTTCTPSLQSVEGLVHASS